MTPEHRAGVRPLLALSAYNDLRARSGGAAWRDRGPSWLVAPGGDGPGARHLCRARVGVRCSSCDTGRRAPRLSHDVGPCLGRCHTRAVPGAAAGVPVRARRRAVQAFAWRGELPRPEADVASAPVRQRLRVERAWVRERQQRLQALPARRGRAAERCAARGGGSQAPQVLRVHARAGRAELPRSDPRPERDRVQSEGHRCELTTVLCSAGEVQRVRAGSVHK